MSKMNAIGKCDSHSGCGTTMEAHKEKLDLEHSVFFPASPLGYISCPKCNRLMYFYDKESDEGRNVLKEIKKEKHIKFEKYGDHLCGDCIYMKVNNYARTYYRQYKCMHDSCFEEYTDTICHRKRRILGHENLNFDRNCKHFQPNFFRALVDWIFK